ncbi:hypothetical protein ACXR2U_03115 [Jatrophihabitans sp. YIM 134969]
MRCALPEVAQSPAGVPATDVEILATGLELETVVDATIVRGALDPALVAGLGRANWCRPRCTDHPTNAAPHPAPSLTARLETACGHRGGSGARSPVAHAGISHPSACKQAASELPVTRRMVLS